MEASVEQDAEKPPPEDDAEKGQPQLVKQQQQQQQQLQVQHRRSEKIQENIAIVPLFETSTREYRRGQFTSMLYLPMELQFLVCSFLSYGDLQRLRCVNRFYRHLINIDFIRICLGSPATDAELRFVCGTCRRYDPIGRRLVWLLTPHRASALPPGAGRRGTAGWHTNEVGEVHDYPGGPLGGPPGGPGLTVDVLGPNDPLSGHCADCAVRAGKLNPGEYVLMEAGERKVRVCRWCGWPCAATWTKTKDDEDITCPRHGWQLHPRCAWMYQMVIIGYYVLVCIRSGIALVTYILLWRVFAGEQLVVVPSVIAFLLMGGIFAIIIFRGHAVRTYHVVGSLEFSVLALGIPPLYTIIDRMRTNYDAGMIATEVLLITHLIIRFINVLGNIVLFLEYDITKHHAPDIPPFRRHVVNPLIAGLIFWTSPMAIENLWIGRGKNPKHKSIGRVMARSWRNAVSSVAEFFGSGPRDTLP